MDSIAVLRYVLWFYWFKGPKILSACFYNFIASSWSTVKKVFASLQRYWMYKSDCLPHFSSNICIPVLKHSRASAVWLKYSIVIVILSNTRSNLWSTYSSFDNYLKYSKLFLNSGNASSILHSRKSNKALYSW